MAVRQPAREKQTFSKLLPGVAAPLARQTYRITELMRVIGYSTIRAAANEPPLPKAGAAHAVDPAPGWLISPCGRTGNRNRCAESSLVGLHRVSCSCDTISQHSSGQRNQPARYLARQREDTFCLRPPNSNSIRRRERHCAALVDIDSMSMIAGLHDLEAVDCLSNSCQLLIGPDRCTYCGAVDEPSYRVWVER